MEPKRYQQAQMGEAAYQEHPGFERIVCVMNYASEYQEKHAQDRN